MQKFEFNLPKPLPTLCRAEKITFLIASAKRRAELNGVFEIQFGCAGARHTLPDVVAEREQFKENRFWRREEFQISSPLEGEEEKSWVWAERSEGQALDFSGEG